MKHLKRYEGLLGDDMWYVALKINGRDKVRFTEEEVLKHSKNIAKFLEKNKIEHKTYFIDDNQTGIYFMFNEKPNLILKKDQYYPFTVNKTAVNDVRKDIEKFRISDKDIEIQILTKKYNL